MEIVWEIIQSVWWVNIILAILVVFLGRNKNPRSTLMWMMVLTMLPGIGFIFFIFLGQDFRKNKMFKLKKEHDKFISDIALFQTDFISTGRIFGENKKILNYYDLIRMNLEIDESFYTQDNSIDIFYWGEDKFDSLLSDIASAEESIDIQYYIFKYDRIGKIIIGLLEEKAKEGVKVRLLYDGVGGRRLKKSYFKNLIKLGGQVEVFFPSIIRALNIKINYRNHRKIVIIDNKIGYVGGFNVGDEYLGLHKKFGKWRDTHLRIEGSGVLGLKFRFLKDWIYASNDQSHEAPKIVGSHNIFGSSGVQILTSGPDTEFENIKNAIFKMIVSAKKEVYIQTPYFVPDESVFEAIRTAVISGVEVNIMIPGNPDHPFVYWASLSYLGQLIKIGAKVHLYKDGFMHCKTVIVDDFISTVGSTNIDIRSFSLNFEVNAIIYDSAVNKSLKDQYLEDVKACKLLTWEEYQARGRLVKLKESFSRLLSPIL